jgi:hypothetical protein
MCVLPRDNLLKGHERGGTIVSGFEIAGAVDDVETIAIGRRIRELGRLQRVYGQGRWRKRKGIATIRLDDGSFARAEVHWYEAGGVGRKEFKIKRILDVGA